MSDLTTRPSVDVPQPPERHRPVTLIVAVVLGVIVAAVGTFVLWQGSDGDDTSTGPSTTAGPGTTVAPSTTEAPTTTTAPPQVDRSTAVFPHTSGSVRYDDPVAAARGFAVDFAGFTEPMVGDFMQGDARSGEVEVRPAADGPVTTVFVRQLGPDDSWWVLGSATGNITVGQPATGATITSPVTVTGSALAYEGQVIVKVRQDGSTDPIGEGFVVGGGGPAAPFDGEIEFSTPTANHGALVFMTRNEMDGRVWEFASFRVRFG